ncbi:hypothetical protein CPB84DRAFT_1850760 [Gymnopilus junonius]|uniref:DUF1308 domain-containing protein n=1 Tax=Gymnopilus junonius TaxID=109634 RepID=A0A9P5NGW7_GYMJU|nr:hypothetical protein CPB84DRAFT_1850760 [Gymnopilus junonius]
MSPHPELRSIRGHLIQIHDAISNFKPLTARPPILDSSCDTLTANENNEDNLNHWLQPESVPGLKKLKESIKLDLEVLEKFLDDPNCANLSPLSTNAPYLVAVWNELVFAPPLVVSVFKTFSVNASASTSSDKGKGRNEQQRQPPGVKVDIVADNGRRWIRVNTTKNSRMLSEFREIDSYLTDSSESSDSEWDSATRPSLAQTEFDNSILRMARSLLAAAQSNPIDGASQLYPKVTLRLTRLDPTLPNDDGTPPDPRIAQTIECLREMGVNVELGERSEAELAENFPASSSTDEAQDTTPNLPYTPTPNINLDLSVLIALISDLTHASLPQSKEEANKRFVPPQEYREWKQKRLATLKNTDGKSKSKRPTDSHPGSVQNSSSDSLLSSMELETDINDLPRDLIKHARALTNQLLQEMIKGTMQEVYDRIHTSSQNGTDTEKETPTVVFWTTSEARDRCLRIVSKIGGIHEKRRARALFSLAPGDTAEDEEIPLEEAERLYWQDSRFPKNFIPLLPIRILPAASPDGLASSLAEIPRYPRSNFALSLGRVCADILAQETMPHPRSRSKMSPAAEQTDDLSQPRSEIQRASVTKANPRLTAHTVQSMQWGAELGWTTLTANRTSVKAILREVRGAKITGRVGGSEERGRDSSLEQFAAIWIVDPRSLAEGMSSLPSARNSFSTSE